MRPTAIPKINGNTKRSPVERRIPSRFFAISTPIHPPSNPPTIVFPANHARGSARWGQSWWKFSASASNLEPAAAPMMAPTITQRFGSTGSASPLRLARRRKIR